MRRKALMLMGGVLLAGSLMGQAMAKPSAAMIAARQKIFGIENVNATNGKVRDDRVVFSWLTNATFAAAMKGHVVLLDSFVTRLEVMPGRTPIVIQDLRSWRRTGGVARCRDCRSRGCSMPLTLWRIQTR